MTGHYDASLVALSLLVAILASYTALDFANSVPAGTLRRRMPWLVAGSFAMGIGIWSMHFIGMLAFHLPGLTIAYDLAPLLASFLIAVVASLLALITISGRRVATNTFVLAGLLLGVAIAGMHYTGMSALRTPATIEWNGVLVVVSLGIAVVASLVALAMALRVRHSRRGRTLLLKLGGGTVMGFAIVGIHFMVMAAATFTPHAGVVPITNRDIIASGGLGYAVTASSTIILALAIGGSIVTREMARRAELLTRISQSEEYFRALIEHGTELISVVDASGVRKFVSPSYEHVLGYKSEELVGKSGFSMMHPDDIPRARDLFERLVRRPGAVVRTELRTRHRDGGWRILSGTGQNLLDDPAVQGVVLAFRDETERRRLEADFQHAQKMESVGRLAGGVAHDFNNLLTVIIGNVQLLLKEPVSERERESTLNDVNAAAERAATLTRQLLAFSRRQMLQPRVVNLNDVVSSMENVLKSVAGEGIPVRVDLEPRLWPVRADPRQVEQALVNLAVNARDAMPSGGTLRITLRNARNPVITDKANEIVPPGDYVSIAVSDTGSGIDAATMPRIFEPFFTTKEVGKGTGLGLSTVYGIMKQTGGYVCANSSPGRGSEFTLYFVRAQEDENGGAKETNGAAHAKAEPEAHARIRLHRG